jgi:hypothetical protein
MGKVEDAIISEMDVKENENLHKNAILMLNDYIESRGNAVGPVLESYFNSNDLPDGDVVKLIRHFQDQPRDPALVTSLLNRFLEGKKGISEELVRRLVPDLTVEANKTNFASKKILYPASLLRQLSKNPGIMGSHHSTLIIIDDFTREVRIKDTAKIEKLGDYLFCNAPDRTSSVKGNILSEEKINVSEDDNNNADVRIHTMTGNPQIRENTGTDTIHMDTTTGNLQIRKKPDMKDFE